jgi:hypothetical protein
VVVVIDGFLSASLMAGTPYRSDGGLSSLRLSSVPVPVPVPVPDRNDAPSRSRTREVKSKEVAHGTLAKTVGNGNGNGDEYVRNTIAHVFWR